MPEGQSDKDKGKITIPWKWRDEEGELDLTDPNDLEKAKRLINQGYGYEKGQQELKAVKGDYEKAQEQIDYWNNLIEDATRNLKGANGGLNVMKYAKVLQTDKCPIPTEKLTI